MGYDFSKSVYDSSLFDDLESLTLSEEEIHALLTLHNLSDDSGCEYGCIGNCLGLSAPFTSNETNRIDFSLISSCIHPVNLYHSHTNETLFSRDDFAFLIRPYVEKISVITPSGLIFSAYTGDAIVPQIEEYREFVISLEREVDFDLIDYPQFYEWTPEKRFYEAVKEQAYRIARHFKWHLEGGTL